MAIRQRITIQQVARLSGVSKQTVSRVINNRPDVSPETRAVVEAAIKSSGFQPSALARGLTARRSMTIGVIAAGLGYSGVARILTGMAAKSSNAGYALLLEELVSFESPAEIGVTMDFLISHRVEGIIFAAPEVGSNVKVMQATLPPNGPPIIFVGSHGSAGISTVGIDNYHGARAATEHLVANGRQRIAHLTGPLDWLTARERRDGWHDALKSARLPMGPSATGDWSPGSGYSGLERLLAADEAFDGIFAANDDMALGAMSAAHAHGISIPADLAVIGFDDVPDARYFSPPLTTVRQPLDELGRRAVEQLLLLIADDGTKTVLPPVILDTELVVRDSAPAKSWADQPMSQGPRPFDGSPRAGVEAS